MICGVESLGLEDLSPGWYGLAPVQAGGDVLHHQILFPVAVLASRVGFL